MPLINKDTTTNTTTTQPRSILCRVRIFALGSVISNKDNDCGDGNDNEEGPRIELDAGDWNHDTFETRTERTFSSVDTTDVDVDAAESEAAGEEVETETETLIEEEDTATEASLSGGLLGSKSASESDILQAMLEELSEEDLETAALASYHYYYLQLTTKEELMGMEQKQSLSQQYASSMAKRHLRAEKGDGLQALEKLKQTLQFRRYNYVNETRESFHDSTKLANSRQRRISQYLGPQGKLFVRGYDPKGRACVHCIPRHSSEKENEQDPIGCLLSFLYILEKAIACSERHEENTDGMIIVSVDLKGFQQKLHLPPMNVVREMLIILRDHYPERLYRVYLMDAPFIFRYTWALLRPRMDPDTRAKFQFVTGRFQRLRVFRAKGGAIDWSQCMPYQHPKGQLVDPIDMDSFYQLPFDELPDDEMSSSFV